MVKDKLSFGLAQAKATNHMIKVGLMSGVITSETSDLGSGSEDTFRLWNSRVYSTSMVFANIASSSDCVLMVSNLLTGTNYVDVTVYNSGGSACTSTYTLNFFVVN